MHASEGAEQVYGASERLRRAQDRVAAAEAALARARRELQAAQRADHGWTDGIAGRRHVAETLAALQRYGWTFLDAVHWPGRPGVVIDHVGVGPGGVVVMFSRQWTGAIDVRGGVLRQNAVPRLREVTAVSAAAGAVSALLPPTYRSAVSAFVCAVQHDVRPSTVAPGVNVVGVRDVARAVTALPARLQPQQADVVLATLQGALIGPDAPEQLTTRALTVYGEGSGTVWPVGGDELDASVFEREPGGGGTFPDRPLAADGTVNPGTVNPGTVNPGTVNPGIGDGVGRPARPADDALVAGGAGTPGPVDRSPSGEPSPAPGHPSGEEAAPPTVAGPTVLAGGPVGAEGWRPLPSGEAAVRLAGRHRSASPRSLRPPHHVVRGSDLSVGLLGALAGAGAGVAGLVVTVWRALT